MRTALPGTLWFVGIFSVAVAACGSEDNVQDTTDSVPPTDTLMDTTPADTVEVTGDAAETSPETTTIVLVHTANENGAIAGAPRLDLSIAGGAALVMAAWEQLEPANRIALSSGDSFSGMAISGWFDGRPAIEAMNAMGYDAMALGNREFDLGREALDAWREAAEFPVLAANITLETPDATLPVDAPWALFERGGVTVGVIGLTHPDMVGLASPRHLEGLVFAGFVDALGEALPEVRAAGADVVVAVAHLPDIYLVQLAGAYPGELAAVFGGHSLLWQQERVGDTLVVQSGSAWIGYGRVELTVDSATGALLSSHAELIMVDLIEPALESDPGLQAMVEGWEAMLEAALGETIGYLRLEQARMSWALANLITDSWRWRFPEAEVAIQNVGGLRTSLGPGAITREDVVNMLSFENVIYRLELTGAQLVAQIEAGLAYCPGSSCLCVSGVYYERTEDGVEVAGENGKPLNPSRLYTVLVNDFMYSGGAGFSFDDLDPEPWDTLQNYREPVMDWIEAQDTNADSPLDGLLDQLPRDRTP
jgi:5'-nucleotidase/UDP-sugar diphosphatase